jgi:peptidoglycan/LPS O-acetylase OafA/YrhL
MRYKELDCLRGIAALIVVFGHMFNFYMTDAYANEILINLILYSPLRIFITGREAVILFFILSGFVLSISYSSHNVKYKNYLIKRICRIHFPYLIAIIFSFILIKLCNLYGVTQTNNLFSTVTIKDLLYHLTLIGSFDATKINGAIWSLVVEMRISIIFPFLMYFIKKYKWKNSIIIASIFSVLTFLTSKFIPSIPAISDVLLTSPYILYFVIGAILAEHRLLLIKQFKTNRVVSCVSLVIAVLFYIYSRLLYEYRIIPVSLLSDWIIALGGSIIIIFVLSYNRFLLIRPLKFLGSISFSLYLLHTPIIKSFIYVFSGHASISIILFSALLTSILLATISYKFIELPFIALGKRLTASKSIA